MLVVERGPWQVTCTSCAGRWLRWGIGYREGVEEPETSWGCASLRLSSCAPLRAAMYLPKRTDTQCLHRWQKVLNPNVKKTPFTAEVRARLACPQAA
jgi:hypothetical protein